MGVRNQALSAGKGATLKASVAVPDSLSVSLLRSALHRVDAWGVAFLVASTALVVHRAVRIETLGLAVGILLMYWVAYTINDYFDAPFDAQEPSKARTNAFVASRVNPGAAAVLIGVACLAVAAAFAPFGIPALLVLALFSFVAVAYSVPPARLKSRPGVDLLVHAVFVQTYAYFACLVALDVDWTPADYAIIALNFLSSLSGQLRQQLRDFEIDSHTDRTFAVVVGQRPALILFRVAQILVVAVFGGGLLSGVLPLYLAPFGLIAAPALIESLVPTRIRSRSARITHIALAAAFVYLAVLSVLFV